MPADILTSMTSPPVAWDDYRDLLKLSTSQLVELLALRPGDAAGHGNLSARAWQRVPVIGALWIPVILREPSGSSHRLKVYPVDISSGGMCFLVGMFVHPKSECELTITLPDRELITLDGCVVRCHHLRGRAHEVGLALSRPFDLGLLSPSINSAVVSPAENSGTHMVGRSPTISRVPPELAASAQELKGFADRLNALDGVAERVRAIGLAIDALASGGTAP